jgi:hypothetical protein
MPPKKMLEAHEIAELEQWIKLGAPDPRTEEKSSETIAMTLQEAEELLVISAAQRTTNSQH